MKRHMALGLSALLFSLIAVVPAGGAATTTVCQMDYTLKGWSAFYKTSRGSGTISCDNGQTARVKISAGGGGLTIGKSEIREGHGKFSEVGDIKELLGSYVTASAAAGAVKSSEAQALTKGDVSLALAGTGTGMEVGVSFGKLKISRQ